MKVWGFIYKVCKCNLVDKTLQKTKSTISVLGGLYISVVLLSSQCKSTLAMTVSTILHYDDDGDDDEDDKQTASLTVGCLDHTNVKDYTK